MASSITSKGVGLAVGLFGLTTVLYWFALRPRLGPKKTEYSSDIDPPLLKKYSSQKSYFVKATGFSYRSIRIFYRPHPQASRLPSKPLPLPLTVFLHGVGGSAAQFAPILTSLVNAGPCLAIDLPGCGLSAFDQNDWSAYTSQALAHLIETIIEDHRDVKHNQGIIFVAHSMGCSLAAMLGSSVSTNFGLLPKQTIGLVAMCPRITPLSENQINGIRRISQVPSAIFNLWRMWDRRGGVDSISVSRYAGSKADARTRKLQLQYNQQSQTEVWKRMITGMLPLEVDAVQQGIPGDAIWAGLDMPVFLIAGGEDTITPPEEVEKIVKVLRVSWETTPQAEARSARVLSPDDDEDTKISVLKPYRALKTRIIRNATHALPFATDSSRVIAGLIEEFLAERVDQRLSLGWQLQQLSTDGKWDVKNLAKWQKIQRVSEPIGGVFRAMKTMREVDDRHSPKVFVEEWAGKVYAVVDISHESPVYDPSTLDKHGIEYHKFPTVSKLPPTAHEVEMFVELIDKLREKHKAAAGKHEAESLLAVHCHYGFNRTGFFVVCYLVEREGWALHDAVAEFESKRSPGIKHDYFIDALYARYMGGGRRGSLFNM